MMLHVTALDAGIVLKLTTSGGEGIADRDIHIPVSGILPTLRRLDLSARHMQVDAHMKSLATLPMVVRGLHHDMAARDAVITMLKRLRLFVDAGIDGG